jgi:D-3-phosphoglycerate dehydrogenase
LSGPRLARLQAIGETRVHAGRPRDAEAFVSRIRDANALLLGWDLPVAVMQAAEKLELVAFAGIGVGTYVDVAAAARQGITVTNTPGYADRTVAEHALACTLALSRKIPTQDAGLKAGRWEPVAGMELAGKHLGIIGFGGIGQRMAALGKAIGMTVSVWTPHPERYASVHDVVFTSLESLLERADVVSVHIALGEATHGLLDASHLARMRKGALLVNTARGAVIDETALLAALDNGHLGGAALDVFTEEPATNSPLARHPKVVATPHSAYNTPEATVALYERAIEAIEAYHRGTPCFVVPPPS